MGAEEVGKETSLASKSEPVSIEENDESIWVYMPLDEKVSVKQINYRLENNCLTLGVVGSEPLISNEELYGSVLSEDCVWMIDDVKGQRTLVLEMRKKLSGRWRDLLKSDSKADTEVLRSQILELKKKIEESKTNETQRSDELATFPKQDEDIEVVRDKLETQIRSDNRRKTEEFLENHAHEYIGEGQTTYLDDKKDPMQVTLYINRVCPFAHRAWLAALELGVPLKVEEVDIHDSAGKPAWFTDLYQHAWGADPNSDGKVPVMEFAHELLTESDVIVEFLDRQFGGNSSYSGARLMPVDNLEAARLRLFLGTCSKILGPWYRLLTSQDAQVREEAREQLLEVFRQINKELVVEDLRRPIQYPGDLFRGSQISLAEVLYGPWFAERLVVLQHFRNFEIPEEPVYNRLKQWIVAMRSRESFKQSSQSEEFWRNCPAYQKYADGQGLDAATQGMVRQ